MGLAPKDYIPVTAHRSENVDNPVYLARLFEALGEMASHCGRKIIFPMHPRSRSKMTNFEVPKSVNIMSPLGFYDFNKLLRGVHFRH